MKRFSILNYIFLGLFGLIAGSCSRDFETEGISKITYYPTFVLDKQYISIVQGTSYTDTEVTATQDGKTLTVSKKIVGSSYINPDHTSPDENTYRSLSEVDTSTPGMYTITYSSVNSDGYPGSINRYVFVLKEEPIESVDLAGDYKSSTSPASEITKVAPGVFFASNAWGGGSTVQIGAYLICTDGVNINIPQQDNEDRIFGYGTVSGSTLNLKMSRPAFPASAGGPLLDVVKDWKK